MNCPGNPVTREGIPTRPRVLRPSGNGLTCRTVCLSVQGMKALRFERLMQWLEIEARRGLGGVAVAALNF